MAVIEVTRSPVATAGIFGSFFARIITAYAEWSAARATRKALESLSDRELDDIGLTRGDIEAIARSA